MSAKKLFPTFALLAALAMVGACSSPFEPPLSQAPSSGGQVSDQGPESSQGQQGDASSRAREKNGKKDVQN